MALFFGINRPSKIIILYLSPYYNPKFYCRKTYENPLIESAFGAVVGVAVGGDLFFCGFALGEWVSAAPCGRISFWCKQFAFLVYCFMSSVAFGVCKVYCQSSNLRYIWQAAMPKCIYKTNLRDNEKTRFIQMGGVLQIP